MKMKDNWQSRLRKKSRMSWWHMFLTRLVATWQALAMRFRGQGALKGALWRIWLWSSLVTLLLLLALTWRWLDTLGIFDISERQVSSLIDFKAADNSVVFDSEGKKIGEFFDRYHIFVPYDQIPHAFVNALLATEDRNFFQHPGVDIRGMIRAVLVFLRHGEFKQGASTITQQLVRNFILTREKTLSRKVREIALAVKLESSLSKERIFELYCNTLFLGHGAYGIGAASMRYFGKKIDQLEVHELALIAGLFQSPSRYNPRRDPKAAKKRQKQVVTAMFRSGYLGRDEAIAVLRKPLKYHDYQPLNETLAPYFIDFIREQTADLLGSRLPKNKGLRIHTTLNSRIQTLANEVVTGASDIYKQANKGIFRNFSPAHNKTVTDDSQSAVEAALLSVEPNTGAILAMVGGRDYNKSKYNRTVQAKRSPGSAFKPIVYSLALQQGRTWADQFYVTPVSVGHYRPKNFSSRDYLTESTLLRAFFKSMNSVTIQVGKKLKLKPILAYAKKLGVESTLKEEPGTMLGASEATMVDLARVYSVFANYGAKPNIHGIVRIEDREGHVLFERDVEANKPQRVISPQQAYLMTAGMREVLKRGTAASASRHAGYAAGKTGTSNEAKDNWFCGYTRNLTTIVWVGTDDSRAIYGKATGGDLALPIWDRFMTKIANQKLRKVASFGAPVGIRSARVHSRYGHRSRVGTKMYFLEGTAPTVKHSDLEAVSAINGYRDVFGH